MEKLLYGKPTMRIHGSIEKLTQVFGEGPQDFINGSPVTVGGVTTSGSFNGICTPGQTPHHPPNCEFEPNP